ncbi:hypothetical protein MRX96_008650 [Rhipicephalus microplus]
MEAHDCLSLSREPARGEQANLSAKKASRMCLGGEKRPWQRRLPGACLEGAIYAFADTGSPGSTLSRDIPPSLVDNYRVPLGISARRGAALSGARVALSSLNKRR